MSELSPQALLIAVGGGVLEYAALRAVLKRPQRWPWHAANYQGRCIPTSVGLLLIMPQVAALPLSVWMLDGVGASRAAIAFGGVVLLFALLGLQDDLRPDDSARGLAGHLRTTWRQRRPTSGAIKAVGGAAAGFAASALLRGAVNWEAVLGGAVTALGANAINALDWRPGRACKGFLALSALLLIAARPRQPLLGAALLSLVAAAGAYLPADLGARVMLGDAGANPLGAALGLVAVSTLGLPAQGTVAAVLLAFCLMADRISLTETIPRVPLLGWLDRLGTRPEACPHDPPSGS